MSPANKLGSTHSRPVAAEVTKDGSRRTFDWAVLVVAFALGCTLAWAYVLLWVAVRAFRTVLV